MLLIADFSTLDFNEMYYDVHSAINIVFNYMSASSTMPVLCTGLATHQGK